MSNSYPAFMLSLISGIIILIYSTLRLYWSLLVMPISHEHWMMGPWMNGLQSMMSTFSIIGIIAGALVFAGAIMMYKVPQQLSTWGIIVLVFSLLSLIAGGGLIIGSVLGFVGGLLAITTKTT
ncbi:MAG: hypothetical protein DRJ98_04540 [Thermoprotei archaeon]|nr:MAG: hypothetical protein DRJ98_04540 [Thermoprotei archaeon]